MQWLSARPERKVLLQLVKMDVEGEMTEMKTSCGAAIIRVHLDYRNRSSDIGICGTNQKVIAPITSLNNSIRIRSACVFWQNQLASPPSFSFLTAPEKVNGLSGFNFTWTEVRMIESESVVR